MASSSIAVACVFRSCFSLLRLAFCAAFNCCRFISSLHPGQYFSRISLIPCQIVAEVLSADIAGHLPCLLVQHSPASFRYRLYDVCMTAIQLSPDFSGKGRAAISRYSFRISSALLISARFRIASAVAVPLPTGLEAF